MRFESILLPGVLVRRYKRFLADVVLYSGEQVTTHTPNTGSMRGCAEPGMRVWVRDTADTRRKYPLSWELVEATPGILVGINTLMSNGLVREAIADEVLCGLTGYGAVRSEVPYGCERSRIDILLSGEGQSDCYVEVKNVTWAEEGVALFPDAVSVRGTKHLRELVRVVQDGLRGVVVFCVQRRDVHSFRPAEQVDSDYAAALRAARDAGVEVLACRASVTTRDIRLTRCLPVDV